MSNFIEMRDAVCKQATYLLGLTANKMGELVSVKLERDELFNEYLNAIPAEHNPIFRERQYYNGNYDKHFIRNVGGMVFISVTGKLTTIWDVKLSENNFFQPVMAHLSNYVRSKAFNNYFLRSERVAGHLANVDNYDETITWEHFYLVLPTAFVSNQVAERLGKYAGYISMLRRAMNELTIESAETVLDLIKENNLYRGKEFEPLVTSFIELKQHYDVVSNKEHWLWLNARRLGEKSRIHSTVMGTLLADLSQGVDVEQAVKSFESKVAPTNYKRSSAIVTPMMVERARATLLDLGVDQSVYRRLATVGDIPVDKVLFTSTKHRNVDVFADMAEEAGAVVKNVDKAETISGQAFLAKLKSAVKIEVLKRSNLVANEMVLTAAADDTAPGIFKWGNTLAWAYTSDTTDAIKERVKQAGGNVEGEFRVSLAWHSPCDLDLHCYYGKSRGPDYHIYFSNKRPVGMGLQLDLDMNGIDKKDDSNPVENIFSPRIKDIPNGIYRFQVHNYAKRMPAHQYFDIQIEILGDIKTYRYDGMLPRNMWAEALVVEVRNGEVINVDVDPDLELVSATKARGVFEPVQMVMKSPNAWGETSVGNEHLFFITDNFKMEKPVRGFFVEYLDNKFNEHRKVFEVLGSKLMIEPEENCLGGYGFSLTSKAEFTVRLDGKQIYNVKL